MPLATSEETLIIGRTYRVMVVDAECVCFIPTSKVGPSSHTGLERDRCSPLGLSAMSGSKYISKLLWNRTLFAPLVSISHPQDITEGLITAYIGFTL